jgi:alpha/beta superfamily hydrolase
VEHQNLLTSDGQQLEADLLAAELRSGESANGVLVICHPHPLYGGNRFSVVVDTVFRAAPTLGYHTLRFDFRSAHDHGRAEILDVLAAIDAIADRHPGLPVHLIGYSFGAMVALATDDPRVVSIIAIAPPLGMGAEPTPTPVLPVLILSPAHDQFCTPEQAGVATARWHNHEIHPIPMADHSVSGQTASLMPTIGEWLSRERPASPPPPHR